MKKATTPKKDFGATLANILESHIQLAKQLIQRLDIAEAKLEDLWKVQKSDQAAIKVHQKVLEMLFRKPSEKGN
jgi:hypothetical protein